MTANFVAAILPLTACASAFAFDIKPCPAQVLSAEQQAGIGTVKRVFGVVILLTGIAILTCRDK